MYPFLDRRLRKLSTETLFTPFGLKRNKLGEEKRGKNDQLKHFKNEAFIKVQKCSLWLDLDSKLSKISNGTKIRQNGVRMKRLFPNGVRTNTVHCCIFLFSCWVAPYA